MMTKNEIVELIDQEDVEFIRLQFTDMFGNLKNISITANQFERVLENKYVFDGTAVYDGFKECEEDMYLYPDLETFVILPWRPQQGKVARFLCNVYHEDGTLCKLSPRTILERVLKETKEKGYDIYIDPECEFFFFHSDENGIPSTVTHECAGYMSVGPIDQGENPRRDMVLTLEEMGFEMESSHHEKAPGQNEIDFREAEPLKTADSVITFRNAVLSIAKRFGMHATFMPKPKRGVAGSGMHLNISVYKDGRNLFNSNDENIREEAKWFMGGVMEHAKGMCAVTNPLVNSYKRINSGFGAPKDIVWTTKNQNALLRLHSRLGEDTKVEIRFPDSAANPYLAIAVCMAAGIKGIENHTSVGKMYSEVLEKGIEAEKLPGTLYEAVKEMQKDSFIENVLGEEFVSIYSDAKLAEWNDYMEDVSDWEVSRYLSRM